MARPRKQAYTNEMYLKKNKNGDIDNSADTQRNFVWKTEQINGLIRTVLLRYCILRCLSSILSFSQVPQSLFLNPLRQSLPMRCRD